MIQERSNSVLGMLPNWLYSITPHGYKLQRYLNIVHALPLRVGRWTRSPHIQAYILYTYWFQNDFQVLRDRKKQMKQRNAEETNYQDDANKSIATQSDILVKLIKDINQFPV